LNRGSPRWGIFQIGSNIAAAKLSHWCQTMRQRCVRPATRPIRRTTKCVENSPARGWNRSRRLSCPPKLIAVCEILRSKAGKAFAACWLLSVLSIAGFGLVGLVDRDVASAVAVGVLVAAPFIDMAVLASYWAGSASYSIARATWIVLSIALLASALLLLRSGKSDADVLLTYGAAALAFPLGLIADPLTGQFSMSAGPSLTTLIWVMTIGAGYLQWFVLITMLLKARAKDRAEAR
jgi:hypothetical protein